MSKKPMEIYHNSRKYGGEAHESAIKAVHADARREALEAGIKEVRRIHAACVDAPPQGRAACKWIESALNELLNASPGSGVPDDAEGRGQAPSTSPDAASSDQPGIAQDDGREKEGSTPSGRVPSAASGQAILWSEPRWNGREWYRVGSSTGASIPPATTNAAPQEIGEYNDSLSKQLWTMPAAAAPSGPKEWEEWLAVSVCRAYEGGAVVDRSTLILARAVIRWKEQSK